MAPSVSTSVLRPDVSVIIVCYNMAREAERSLYSLSVSYQRSIAAGDYEIIVVDNGSDVPIDPSTLAGLAGNFRLIRIDPASPSPAHAVNRGLSAARGDVIGVMIDGARIATPGLLHFARHGARLYENAVVATLGWYLGHDFQGWSARGQRAVAAEDALLAEVEWPSDGYRLFEIGTMDESSVDGWFRPISESNAVFARRAAWDALGGVDERFDSPGGGLLNLDTFDRLLAAPAAELVVLLGEATFHQLHGGVNTNATPQRQRENFERWAAQYAAIRGHAWQRPVSRPPPTYIGTLPPAALARMVRAATHPVAGAGDLSEAGVLRDVWSGTAVKAPRDERFARLVELGRDEFDHGRFAASGAVARLLRERAPAERGLDRILSLVAPSSSIDGPPLAGRVAWHLALGDAHGILGEPEDASAQYRQALALAPDLPRAHLGLSRLRMPGDDYLRWLERMYAAIAPESVIEIGVFEGASLALLRPPTVAIGVDPNARVLTPLATETHIFAETSDEFFARGRARAVLGERALSAGFIDGLHLFEQALRDFIGLEALCDESSLIMLHDTVPLDEATQTRSRETVFHTGDVWKLVLCLKHYRPELEIVTIATAPTGLTIVSGLDPSSRVLERAYDEAVARFIDVPFASIENDAARALNLVPNDWSMMERRLEEQRLGSRDRTPAAGIAGTHVVDRDQPPLSPEQTQVVRDFHDLYYTRWSNGGGDTINTSWFGYQTLKCPLDLWLYQELLFRTRPDVVIETGTWRGGSALYLAMMFDQLNQGRVITVDINADDTRPRHPRITYVLGSSTDPGTVTAVHNLVDGARAMVILDSDHAAAHVYDEIVAYQPLVRAGDYLIVEDTNVNGHPTFPEFGPGPMEAVERFLAENSDFTVDRRCERFLMTLNPGGYLRRGTA
jgi:cephalosporin hydroxylase